MESNDPSYKTWYLERLFLTLYLMTVKKCMVLEHTFSRQAIWRQYNILVLSPISVCFFYGSEKWTLTKPQDKQLRFLRIVTNCVIKYVTRTRSNILLMTTQNVDVNKTICFISAALLRACMEFLLQCLTSQIYVLLLYNSQRQGMKSK